jgi:hypothetical protein
MIGTTEALDDVFLDWNDWKYAPQFMCCWVI